ncbi:MAG TPA: hypothetical protein VG033_01115 [Candidatus Acidoferrales bacterium]|jgi:predicted RNase H-like nuclease (RuvC/YqgF family)|nr:hypothetical protein [Candidatus Acidoferrales bacterium]
MRKMLWIAAAVSLFFVPLEVRAQQPAPSVADAARKAREEKKEAPKTAKVFTNDNIPGAGSLSVVGPPPAESTPAAKDKDKDSAATSPKVVTPPAKDEKYWRETFAKVRKQIQQDQDDLAIMQRELAQLQVQYYPDPQKAMSQQYSQADIKAKQDKIDAKQAEVTRLNQTLSDMEDDLRKSGGDPSWSRE